MYLLSSPIIDGFFGIYHRSDGFLDLTPDLPLLESFTYGLIFGIAHGVVSGLIIYWYKPNSYGGGIISSFAVTELLLLIAFVVGFTRHYINQPVSLGKAPPPTYIDYFGVILMVTSWYLIPSILFLIPSAVIGIANRYFLNLFTPFVLR